MREAAEVSDPFTEQLSSISSALAEILHNQPCCEVQSSIVYRPVTESELSILKHTEDPETQVKVTPESIAGVQKQIQELIEQGKENYGEELPEINLNVAQKDFDELKQEASRLIHSVREIKLQAVQSPSISSPTHQQGTHHVSAEEQERVERDLGSEQKRSELLKRLLSWTLEKQSKEKHVVDTSLQELQDPEVLELQSELEACKFSVTEYENHATQFDCAKLEAAKKPEIQALEDRVRLQQQQVTETQNQNELLADEIDCVRNAIYSFIQEYTRNSTSIGEFSHALEIIVRHNGEMLLDDLKEALTPKDSDDVATRDKFQVLQTIYGLVADGLVSIDRSEAANRVILLI